MVALAPLAVNDAGTLAQVLLPELASTGEVRVAAIGSRNLGFGSAVDQVHRGITLIFTPGSETATLHFADGGLQGLDSETWGLDNVRVTRGGTTVFEDDFEGGAKAQWSSGAIESEAVALW